jgi:hypothetical protein
MNFKSASIYLKKNFYLLTKIKTMKKIIFAVLFGTCIIGYTAAYSQDDHKATEKPAKVEKKEHKGKHKKAVKKAEKMEKKEDKDK